MQLTKKSSYGLIVVLDLAGREAHRPIAAKAIADKYNFPVAFVEKILHQLRKAGLVTARKGRGGGYTLSLDPQTSTVLHILEALGEPLDLVGCLKSKDACRSMTLCPTKTLWQRIDRRFKALLDSFTLESLLAGDKIPGTPVSEERSA